MINPKNKNECRDEYTRWYVCRDCANHLNQRPLNIFIAWKIRFRFGFVIVAIVAWKKIKYK